MSVLIAMSGGVDSSVSAYLIREKYKNCRGATMILFACADENIRDAKSVCNLLGIEHEILNFTGEFEDCVIKKFVNVYENGGTPNPCIDCNKFLKFGKMLDYAKSSGLERIATGHYARIERVGSELARTERGYSEREKFTTGLYMPESSRLQSKSSGRFLLRKAEDLSRDQSYVLYSMTQEILSRVDFPLGGMKKSEVRELAEELNFVNAKRHDSQDICFVPDGNYGRFIENYTGKKYQPGNFVDPSGKILGTHNGIIYYTAGQRRGLGVAAKSRLYISEIDTQNNTITLSPECLMTKKIIVNNINLIAFDKIPENFSACVKVRYRQREIPAIINQVSNSELVIEFQSEQKAPAIGQAAVIYDGDYVIGGGTIIMIK